MKVFSEFFFKIKKHLKSFRNISIKLRLNKQVFHFEVKLIILTDFLNRISHYSVTLKQGNIIYATIMVLLSFNVLSHVQDSHFKIHINSIYYQANHRDLWLGLSSDHWL